MLVKENGGYNFRDARWDELGRTHPEFASVLLAGADDDASARDRRRTGSKIGRTCWPAP